MWKQSEIEVQNKSTGKKTTINQLFKENNQKNNLEITKISHGKSKNSLNFVNTSQNWTDNSIKI